MALWLNYCKLVINIIDCVINIELNRNKELFILNDDTCPRGVMVKAMDCGIIVSEFELQSRYYTHFRANTLGKGMKRLILSTMC